MMAANSKRGATSRCRSSSSLIRHEGHLSTPCGSPMCLFALATSVLLLWAITPTSSLLLPPSQTRLPLTAPSSKICCDTAVEATSTPTDSGTQTDLFGSHLSGTDPKSDAERSTDERFYSENQIKSIQSNAPAVLLKSGPGTGKSYALASRIAYLLQSKRCRPEQMVILSFTNRDAHTLKERAINMLVKESGNISVSIEEVTNRLWSGTIHAFASNIIRAYGKQKLRVLSSQEMRIRVDKCLGIILEDKPHGRQGLGSSLSRLKAIRILHRDALVDTRQSRGLVLHQICRCIELWKEAGLLSLPGRTGLRKASKPVNPKVSENCVELSMRLGISQNVALLAVEVLSQYQSLHEASGTADPSDLATIASQILQSNSKALASFRTKLKHVILDEYQDVSVTQHSLIRLIVRGVVDENDDTKSRQVTSVPPVLECPSSVKNVPGLCFQVPKLFCGGDSQQSIYGWRGAAPCISMEGFRRDYPQGIVVSLDTSFRLGRGVWMTVNQLVDPSYVEKENVKTFAVGSSVLMRRHACESDETLHTLLSKHSKADDFNNAVRIQGLWDAREESKFIASAIRKRYKSRMKRLAAALAGLDAPLRGSMKAIQDPSDVSIMVRSANQMELIKEALAAIGIPFVVCSSETDLTLSKRARLNSNLKLMDMKPVVIMTMHRAKGEEFDDVYLAGWTEGLFPHPTAVSTNRVDEERRLAFVAISRARQQVLITHSSISRIVHHDADLNSKYVTTQVSPSRFLFELVPAARTSLADTVHNRMKKRSDSLPTVVWNRGKGIKDFVAGQDVPAYFANSYASDSTWKATNKVSPLATTGNTVHNRGELIMPRVASTLSANDKELLETVKAGLHDISELRKRGSKGTYRTAFRQVLRDRFDLQRGTILVLLREDRENLAFDALLHVPAENLERKALSQSTAIELALYISYCLLSPAMQKVK